LFFGLFFEKSVSTANIAVIFLTAIKKCRFYNGLFFYSKFGI